MPHLLMLHDVCGIRAHFVHVCTTLHLCELTHTAAHTAECLHLSLLLLMRCKLAASRWHCHRGRAHGAAMPDGCTLPVRRVLLI